MAQHRESLAQDRRADVRLASLKKIDAVVVDRHHQPVGVSRYAHVVNVSAGGLMMISEQPIPRGSRVVVNVENPSSTHGDRQMLDLEALECLPQGDHKHRIRCRLVGGAMPARLIYSW